MCTYFSLIGSILCLVLILVLTMLTGDRLSLGTKVTLKLTTFPSPSEPQLVYSGPCTSEPSRPQDVVPVKIDIFPREEQHTERLQDSSSFESSASALAPRNKLASLTNTLQTPRAESHALDITPLPIAVPPVKSQSGVSEEINLVNLSRGHQHPSDCKPIDPSPVPARASMPSIRGPFRKLCMLQQGGFATAWAAEDISSGRLLCLKVFRKKRLKHNRTEEGLLNELDVYKRIASEQETCPAGKTFLMELEMSFQTRRDIYFAMESMANDLLYYMTRESAYCSANARRWSAQMALGINALHCMGIIHRDIKAENILIDIRENVRIADFGLCYMHNKPLDRRWRYSSDVTGTTQWMAPEMLHNRKNPRPTKYGITVDWWSFGCVLYELVSPSHQPLFATEKATIDYVTWQCKPSNTDKLFPAFERLDSSVAGLVAGLLRPLALMRYGFEDLTMHPWFENNDVSEFHDAPNRALRRAEWPHMRPNLQGHTKSAVILTPLTARPGGCRSKHLPDVDWMNPSRSGVVS